MHSPGTAGGRMRKLNFYFPPVLVERLEKIASARSANLSQIVREAVEEFVMNKEREAIEKEIALACKANQDFDRQFASDWAGFETRIG